MWGTQATRSQIGGLLGSLEISNLETQETDGSANNCFIDAVLQQLPPSLVPVRDLGAWRARIVDSVRATTEQEAAQGDPLHMTCTAGVQLVALAWVVSQGPAALPAMLLKLKRNPAIPPVQP
jgi:hypothetical protein